MKTQHKILLAGVGLVALSAIVLAAAWTQRRPIAREIINDYLADRGVKATYDLVEIGPKQQRLENIIIGNPANPDLVIKWAEIDVVTRVSGIEVKAVRASGVKAKGSYKAGKLSFGVIDKLLPPASDKKQSLPDLDLALHDVRAKLDTEFGQIGARVDGKGNLAGAFTGRIGLVAPKLANNDCTVEGATAFGTLILRDQAPKFSGPVRIANGRCGKNSGRKLDLVIDGDGNAALDQFNGTVKLGGDQLAIIGINTQQPRSNFSFDYDRKVNRWDIAATASANQAGGGFGSISGAAGKLDLFYRGDLQQWAGNGTLNGASAVIQGVAAKSIKTVFDFSGTRAQTRGKWGADFARFDHQQINGGKTSVGGVYDLSIDADNHINVESDGHIVAAGLIPNQSLISQIRSLGTKTRNSPVEAIGDALARDLARLGEGGNAKARYSFDLMRGRSRIALNDINANSRSGIRASLNGADALTYTSWSGLGIAGQLALSGGGLPASLITLASQNGGISGTAIVDPYSAGGTRVALSNTSFSVNRGTTNFSTLATLNTTYKGIELRDFTTPLSTSGGRLSLDGCRPISLGPIRAQSLALDPMKINACLSGNRVRITSPDVSGTLAGRAFTLRAQSADAPLGNGMFALDQPVITYLNTQAKLERFAGVYTNGTARFDGRNAGFIIGQGGQAPKVNLATVSGKFANGAIQFDGRDATILLGQGKQQSTLLLDTLSGKYANNAASGTFTNGRGALANVPLDASRANGTWGYVGNVLSAKATSAIIQHAVPEPRFLPLMTDNFAITLANENVTAIGDVKHPAKGEKIANVNITHAIRGGIGKAIISVDQLTFGNRLMIEDVTSLTTGIIEVVAGTVNGKGTIDWTPKGLNSSGTFKTDGFNFGAAFGPVTGLRGEIAFSNLLGLETPGGQELKIGSINPGILAVNGSLKYQLLPGNRLLIEKGEWPLAGGSLLLEETTVNLGSTDPKRLVFDVVNLDASTFIEQMEIENISATGKFTGKLPMIFDESGGRIEGGYLDAEGGTLSYIGPVSRENLGAYGSIAFDALKSMKFNKLHVELGGALDGEMVTKIKFNGVNQLPVTPGRAQFPLPVKVIGLTGIPFIFNITITAPFRGLVKMGRDFQDGRKLIEEQLEKERLERERLEKERLEKAKASKKSKTSDE